MFHVSDLRAVRMMSDHALQLCITMMFRATSFELPSVRFINDQVFSRFFFFSLFVHLLCELAASLPVTPVPRKAPENDLQYC